VDLEETKNELFRKIGRNMLLFQQIEHILKHLVSSSNLTISLGDNTGNNYLSKKASIKKQTLGQVIGRFFGEMHVAPLSLPESEPSAPDTAISFSFKIQLDQEALEGRKEVLAKLVEERNELIHHFLQQYNLQSFEDCNSAHLYLDNQEERIRSELEYLKNLISHSNEAKNSLINFINSEEGIKFFTQSSSDES
jgi:hypothetical protein